MKKPFMNINDCGRLLTKTKPVVVGIVTLIMTVTPSAVAHATTFQSQTDGVRIENAVTVNQETISLPDNIGTIQLELNIQAIKESNTTRMIDEAFNKFAASSTQDVRSLKSLNDEIKTSFADAEILKVQTRGNVDKGYLNVSMLLPKQLVLSINSITNFEMPGTVAFNLLRNRKLIVSDMIPLDQLAQYVRALEARLV